MSHPIAPSIDILVRWGDFALENVELSPPRSFFLGDGSRKGQEVDFTLPDGSLDASRTALIEVDGDTAVVCVPEGARAVRWGRSGASGVEPMGDRRMPLGDETVDVLWGDLVFSLRRSEKAAPCPRAKLDADRRGIAFFSAATLMVASVLGAVAYFTPPLGLTDDEASERDRLYLMQQYLDASAEREERLDNGSDGSTPGAPAAPREAARGQEGAMGSPKAVARNKRASGAAPGQIRPATSRAEDLRLAQNFGVIGILSSGALGATLAPWSDPGAGPKMGDGVLFGDEIGESMGIHGLGPIGIGEGGGGFADQIGLDHVGTCAGSICTDGMGRYGMSHGRLGRNHVASAPRVTMATPVASGSLPPDVIQRIVRQSFGRFRGCYEEGLRGNPTLEGRITTRFVIGRDGSVATVQSGGTDLPDPRVVSCVLRTYSGLTFPPPKDGIVTVSYPLVFSPAA